MSTVESPASPRASDLAALLQHGEPVARRVGRNLSKATLSFYRIEGRRIAVKSFAEHPWWVRQTVGRWSIAREARAYVAAGGARGLPEFYGRVNGCALALEWLDALPLAELESASPEVFDRLDELVEGLHRRGLALGDLHHGDVLVAADGAVHLVDLATAMVRGPRPGPVTRFLFDRLCGLDRIAAARLRARFLGQDPEAAVAAVGGSAAAWHRRGRRLKALWDRLRGKKRRARKTTIDDNTSAET